MSNGDRKEPLHSQFALSGGKHKEHAMETGEMSTTEGKSSVSPRGLEGTLASSSLNPGVRVRAKKKDGGGKFWAFSDQE